jgi:tartrate-resistant acid phosphatase type 5
MKLFLFFILSFTISCKADWVYQKDAPAEEVKLCFLGDTGFNSPLQKSVAEKLKLEGCHWVHFLGDIIYPKGLSSSDDPQFQERFWNYYKNLPQMFLIQGNHDSQGSITAWEEIAKKHNRIFFPHPYYLIKSHDVCIAHLDSNYFIRFLDFWKGLKEIMWLSSLQNELKDCPIRIALTHHPLESRGTHHGPASGVMKYFLESYIIGKYDYLISGHEHILSDEGEMSGTKMFISGGGGKPDKGEKAGFLVMKVKNRKITETVFRYID